MNGVSAFAGLLTVAERDLRQATEGVTADLACWTPPGTANPIGATWLHALALQDWGIQLMQGKPSIWERDGWSARLGVPAPLRQDAALARAMQLDPEAVRQYADAVFAATHAFLAGLADVDLDRTIESPEGPMTVGVGLQLLICHLAQHTGEILALRGVQEAARTDR